jgi:DNA topoisomerase-1
MAKNLVIVESPQRQNNREILGSDFQVESSYGHIADLPQRNRVDVKMVSNLNMKFQLIKKHWLLN